MEHIIVCSCVQLHLLANSSLCAAELPVSGERPLRIMLRTRSIFRARGFSDVHGPVPLLAPKTVCKGTENYRICKGGTAFFCFSFCDFYPIKAFMWIYCL